MCIQVERVDVLLHDKTVWKTVRRSRHPNADWFLSYFPPAWRAPQMAPAHVNVWQGLSRYASACLNMYSEGRTKRYYVGRSHRSNAPGMYCFEHFKQAKAFANRGYTSRPILKCTIPKGTEVVFGMYEGGLTIVTPALRVDSLVTDLHDSVMSVAQTT